MHLVVTGISQKTAPLELRERLALTRDEAALLARRLLDCGPIAEAVVLSTCNRTEVYLFTDDTAAAARCAVESAGRLPGRRCRRAARGHLRKGRRRRHPPPVPGGGEPRLAGRGRGADRRPVEGRLPGGLRRGLHEHSVQPLFRHALEVGKRVRTETTIGQRPVSVSSVAVDLARQVFGKLDRRVVLVLGAGETSELTARHLRAQGVGAVVVQPHAGARRGLAARCEGRAVRLATSSTSSSSQPTSSFPRRARRVRDRPRPLCRHHAPPPAPSAVRDRHRRTSRLRPRRRAPRAVLPVRHRRSAGRGGRQPPSARAPGRPGRTIVAEELARMNEWLAGLEVVPTIAQLRSRRRHPRGRAGAPGRPAQRALTRAARPGRAAHHAIVNKILHLPTVRMKELAAERDVSVYVDALRRLFDLDEPDSGTASTLTPAPACGADAAPAAPLAAEAGAAEAAPSAPLASPAQAS